ncbi:hypothetical protein OKW41_006260 [Paraburkholderia sp. UCT70]
MWPWYRWKNRQSPPAGSTGNFVCARVNAALTTLRRVRPDDPGLVKGDFVKVTGKLKADFYLSREGKPTGTLLVIAFEAAKIAKPAPQPAPATEAPQEA